MNIDIIKGNWHEVKGKIKHQWGKLTDDDITAMAGTYEELAGKLQTSYGYAKEQATKEIDEFVAKHEWKGV
jgi:uncharacterized protein YjbJ (UPF0337 family)